MHLLVDFRSSRLLEVYLRACGTQRVSRMLTLLGVVFDCLENDALISRQQHGGRPEDPGYALTV